MEELKYPICHFQKPQTITADHIAAWIHAIETFPQRLGKEVMDLTPQQLDTPYRPGGWTIRQVVHHCADSHMNSFIRFKLALTDNNPTIKPYAEERWAELSDSKQYPIEPTLQLLALLHARWVVLLKTLTLTDCARTFIHPDSGAHIRIDENMGIYAWHCNHHLAHITTLKQQKGWV